MRLFSNSIQYKAYNAACIIKTRRFQLISSVCIASVLVLNAKAETIVVNPTQYPYAGASNVGANYLNGANGVDGLNGDRNGNGLDDGSAGDDGANGVTGTAAYEFTTTPGSTSDQNVITIGNGVVIRGGLGSAGGSGGNGGEGADARYSNNGFSKFKAGNGGQGGAGGYGGNGAIGVNGGNLTIENQGTISGGNGGAGGNAGSSGKGAEGAMGGNGSWMYEGGDGALGGAGGAGGNGASAIYGDDSFITNGGNIIGGNGGNGGQGGNSLTAGGSSGGNKEGIPSDGGHAGNAGTGAFGITGNNLDITNFSGGTIKGGNGGLGAKGGWGGNQRFGYSGVDRAGIGGNGSNAGEGGHGISGNNLTIRNSGVIIGGNGGNGGDGGTGGYPNSAYQPWYGGSGGNGGNGGDAINGSNLTIINSAVITRGIGGKRGDVGNGIKEGGVDGDSGVNGVAIRATTGLNSLTLNAGSNITGDVVLTDLPDTVSSNTLSIISNAATSIHGNLIAGTYTGVALSGEMVTFTGDATFADNTSLTFDSLVGGTALNAQSLSFSNTSIKGSSNITNWNQTDYSLATTLNGINGAYNDETENALLTTGAKDYAWAFVSNNDLDLTYGLKWHDISNGAEDAYGTFDLKDGATLTIGVALADNGDVTASNQNSWDGKSLTKDGLGTLILAANNIYTGSTEVAGGTLKTGVVDAFASTSGVDVLSGATLNLGGNSQTLGSNAILNNAGTVLINDWDAALLTSPVTVAGNMINSGLVVINNCTTCAGQTLAYTGNWTGAAGTVSIGTVLGDDDSLTDKLTIAGNTSGTTSLKVTNEGGAGAQTVEGIRVIEVDGDSAGTFSLLGDYVHQGEQAVVGGAYAYKLYQGGVSTPTDGDWYLRSQLKPTDPVDPVDPVQPLYQAGVPVYEAYPQALLGLNGLSTLQERVGNRVWAGAGNNVISQGADAIQPYAAPQEAGIYVNGNGAWGRIEGAHNNIKPRFSTSDTDYNQNVFKLQAGIDGLLNETENGTLIGGVFVQYVHGKTKINSVHGDGEISTDGYGLGGTLTWYGNEGFYIDGQAHVTWYRSDLSSNRTNIGVEDDNHGLGYAFSAEAGKRFAINHEWSVTPQAQLVYSRIDFDSFTDTFGAPVSLDKGDSLQGRFGLTLDHETSWQNVNGMTDRAHIYGIANLYYEFLQGTRVDVASTSFASEKERLWGGVGLGGSYNWNDDKYSIYGEGIVNTSLSNFGDSHSLKGNVGFRMKW